MSSASRREADDVGTSPARLLELSRDANRRVRAAVAANPAAPREAVNLLVADADREVVLAVVSRDSLDDRQLKALLSSPESAVREALAMKCRFLDSNLSWDAQSRLSRDEDARARAGLASTTNFLDVFERLLADRSERVRAECAFNPRLADAHAAALLADRSWRVRSSYACLEASDRPSAVELDFLARDRSSNVRWAISLRTNLPESTKSILADDADAQVRHQISERDPNNTGGGRPIQIYGQRVYV